MFDLVLLLLWFLSGPAMSGLASQSGDVALTPDELAQSSQYTANLTPKMAYRKKGDEFDYLSASGGILFYVTPDGKYLVNSKGEVLATLVNGVFEPPRHWVKVEPL